MALCGGRSSTRKATAAAAAAGHWLKLLFSPHIVTLALIGTHATTHRPHLIDDGRTWSDTERDELLVAEHLFHKNCRAAESVIQIMVWAVVDEEYMRCMIVHNTLCIKHQHASSCFPVNPCFRAVASSALVLLASRHCPATAAAADDETMTGFLCCVGEPLPRQTSIHVDSSWVCVSENLENLLLHIIINPYPAGRSRAAGRVVRWVRVRVCVGSRTSSLKFLLLNESFANWFMGPKVYIRVTN